jgi:hypothetical protein
VISFRYHLVSIVAVFLALALGIVVGTTALNGPITTDLRKQVNSLKADRTTLATQVKTLQNQLGDANQFAKTYGSSLVADALTGQSVLLVGLPGAANNVEDGIATTIAAAGGKVVGRVQFTADYIDPSLGGSINTLATTLHPAGLSLPPTSNAGALGGALLAFVLLGQAQSTDQTDGLSAVLSGFASLHMVTVSGAITPATTVVVVGTGALARGDYGGAAEFSFVSALEQQGGHVVVAGDAPSATQGGIVALVRTQLKATVSTVDNADSAIGQVSTVLATAGVVQSQVGHYGTGAGAQALFPNPVK